MSVWGQEAKLIPGPCSECSELQPGMALVGLPQQVTVDWFDICERLATSSCTLARSLALFTRRVELVSAGVL